MQQGDGDIALETEVGKGTAVHLHLPALDVSADEPGITSTEPDAGNDKALVVSDQPDVLDVAVEPFRNMGYDVLSANNGADGDRNHETHAGHRPPVQRRHDARH